MNENINTISVYIYLIVHKTYTGCDIMVFYYLNASKKKKKKLVGK